MAEEKQRELTSQERAIAVNKEIQAILEKYKCSLLARPSYKLRDDGFWSLQTNVEIVPNQ